MGGKEIPIALQKCMESWKKYCPDYEIIRWDETNYDVHKNLFVSQAYDNHKYGFVPDFARIEILYKYGGIYLDTDVEVLKTYNNLLNNTMFIGLEENKYLGTATIGCEKRNPLIKRLLEFYNSEVWDVDFFNNPIIFKYLFEKEPQTFSACKIYPKDYFSPYNAKKIYNDIVEKDNTYSIHWYSNNWNMTRKGYVFLNTKHIKDKKRKIYLILKKNIGYIIKKIIHKE